MKVHVDSAFRVQLAEFPERLLELLRARYTISHPEKEARAKARLPYRGPDKYSAIRTNRETGIVTIPRGLLQPFREIARQCEVELEFDSRVITTKATKVPIEDIGFQLRPYQVEAMQLLISKVQGLVVLPCGGGKTTVGAATIVHLNQPAIVLVHTKELLAQWKDALVKAGANSIRLVSGNKGNLRKIKPGEVVVAMVQSVDDIDAVQMLRSAAVLVVDECFPSNTLISMADGEKKYIQDVKVGDNVLSWNGNEFVGSKVVRCFSRRVNGLVCVYLVGGIALYATENHPVLTSEGWVKAKELQGKEVLVVREDESSKNHNGKLYGLWKSCDVELQASARSMEENWTCLLFERLFKQVLSACKIRNNDKDEQKVQGVCFGANEEKQSNVSPRNSWQGKFDVKKYWSLSDYSWRKWNWINKAAKDFIKYVGKRMVCGVCVNYEQKGRLSEPLQTRYCESQKKDSYRNRWGLPFYDCEKGGRSKERSIFSRNGLDGNQISEWRRVRQVEMVSGKNRVYNLEVEKTHTYVAESIVVHNCHHSPAATWAKVVSRCSARWRWGLTATPERADGWGFQLFHFFGEVIYERTAEELISDGYLVRPLIIPVLVSCEITGKAYRWKVTCSSCRTINEVSWKNWNAGEAFCSGKVKKEGEKKPVKCGVQLGPMDGAERARMDWSAAQTEIMQSEGLLKTVCELAEFAWNQGRTGMVLVPRKETAHEVDERLSVVEMQTEVVTSSSGKVARKDAIDRLRERKLDAVIATQLADEGLDIPVLDSLICVAGGKAKGTAKQRAGRACRPAGAAVPWIFDIVPSSFIYQWAKRRSGYIAAYGRSALASFEPMTLESVLAMLQSK